MLIHICVHYAVPFALGVERSHGASRQNVTSLPLCDVSPPCVATCLASRFNKISKAAALTQSTADVATPRKVDRCV